MAFDGLVMAALGSELNSTILGGVISKIAMPEKDELLFTIRNNGTNYRLLISAGASLPLIYLTDDNKPSPLTAPAFCMLLRKHIGSGKIVGIRQAGLERIMIIDVEHINDLGDLCTKQLILEMMGKYSNIIFATDDNIIIDSIKRVPSSISSVREVLPGRKYSFPDELMKKDILTESYEAFVSAISDSNDSIMRTIFVTYAGISPVISQELCFRAGIDSDKPSKDVTTKEIETLYSIVSKLVDQIKNESFEPTLVLRRDEPVEFAAVYLNMYECEEYDEESYGSISSLLEYFYAAKDIKTRIRQRSADIRKIVTNAIERAAKKYDLQERQLKDCAEKDKYKVYGDLLNTYGYSIVPGSKSFKCKNFYDNDREITIPLDEHKTGIENAKRYFDKYSKLRRTEDALSEEIVKTEADLAHLNSIIQAIEVSTCEGDLSQIRAELADYGYVKKHEKGNKKPIKSQPLHFVSCGEYDIYVGKNNYQNEEVSFKLADGNDWWFHAKGVPGSHVIVKTNQAGSDLPDKVFEDAGSLAAFYSKNGHNDKVEVDYTLRKNLKRVTGGAPGFVIYHTNYSMVAKPKAEI